MAKRRVITTDDTFGYFGAANGVTFLAPEGISTDAEASAGDLAKLIDQIRREKIRALFLENITSPGLVRTISQETTVPLGGALFSDALSQAVAHAVAAYSHNTGSSKDLDKRVSPSWSSYETRVTFV
jgi:zinc/manganese transport system substrate-binding protein